jgi:hypothetical protein
MAFRKLSWHEKLVLNVCTANDDRARNTKRKHVQRKMLLAVEEQTVLIKWTCNISDREMDPS